MRTGFILTTSFLAAAALTACSSRNGTGDGGDGSADARSDVALSDTDTTRDSGGCGLVTCASAHVNCGLIGDGCNSTIDCGSCTNAGETCGGGGMANVCGSGGPTGDGGPICTARTCTTANANCGPVADGCGGLLQCGTCSTAGEFCGGGGPNRCGTGSTTTCTGLCLQQQACAGGGTTTVSGTVFAPARNNPDPIYSAFVYVPNAAVQPFTPGVTCARCGTQVSGEPLVTATTGPDGRFTLRNMPVGDNIPLVIQLGRWRRQVVIPHVTACTDTPLPATLTRLPRNRTEGDIPKMAMVTGDVDALECVLRKIGIDDTEFGRPADDGGARRIHIYVENGADAGRNTPDRQALVGTPATLAQYDMTLLACEGSETFERNSEITNLVNYANTGGRVFATHFSYTWIYGNLGMGGGVETWYPTANWDLGGRDTSVTGIIDTGFPRGRDFGDWLVNVGAGTRRNGNVEITINDPRFDVDTVAGATQRWIYTTGSNASVQHMTFNTPLGAAPDTQCGRVLFSDFHVANSSTNGSTFPNECMAGGLTEQEKVLEFMLFDLSSCIPTNMPTCTPQTCASQGLTCGQAGDGCGNVLTCGPACGTPDGGTCRARTCMEAGANCGPISDGCGNIIQCGDCVAPLTCGGGAQANVCGTIG